MIHVVINRLQWDIYEMRRTTALMYSTSITILILFRFLFLFILNSTIVNSRVLLSLNWVDRKQSSDSTNSQSRLVSKNYNDITVRDKPVDNGDFLLVGFENLIQVVSIQYDPIIVL